MSNLKLDFDLSGSGDSEGAIFFFSPKRRRAKSVKVALDQLPQDDAKLESEGRPPQPVKHLESAKFPPGEEAISGVFLVAAQAVSHWKVFVLSALLVVAFTSLFVVSLEFGSVHHKGLLAPTKCLTRGLNVVCHAETCNFKGRCTGGPRNVIFSSMACADAVRTVTAHEEDGSVQHFPAFLFRVYNTTTFSIDGKRVLFHPANDDCHASTEVLQRREKLDLLMSRGGVQGAVVWISSGSFPRYSVYRGEQLVADMEESVVLVEKFGKSHFVYKFEPACYHWEESGAIIRVFGRRGQLSKPMETFVYC